MSVKLPDPCCAKCHPKHASPGYAAAVPPPLCVFVPDRQRPPHCPYPTAEQLGRICGAILRDADHAADSLGDLRLWLCENLLATPCLLIAMARVISNRQRMRLLREALRRAPFELADLPGVAGRTLEGDADRELKLELVDAALPCLPPRFQIIITLRLHHGAGYRTIGQKLGLAHTTVMRGERSAVVLLRRLVRRSPNRPGRKR